MMQIIHTHDSPPSRSAPPGSGCACPNGQNALASDQSARGGAASVGAASKEQGSPGTSTAEDAGAVGARG